MNMAEIKRIIKQETVRRGYEILERESTSSDSVYFTIYSGKYSLLFRISDHKTYKNVITLRIDKKISIQSIQNFIYNRCEDLKKRKLKGVLNLW